MADEGQPLSREQVAAAWNQAAADGTLRRNDYDYDKIDARALSSRTRQEVVAELAAARPNPALVGPLRNRTYNPAGMETLRVSTLPRAEVKAQVVAAVRDGTLRHSDYDDLPVRTAHRATRSAAPVLAGAGGRLSSGG
jgi:hypothetical protein